MCSVDSCTDLKVEKKLDLTGAICRKCDEKRAQVVLQGKFPYCRECFLIYFQHKYSGGIGKSKVLKTGDNVLVAFSGSFSSVCLLRLIHSSLIEDRKKKTKFNVTVIFIDERLNNSGEERHTLFKSISDLVSGYGYKLFYSCLNPFSENIFLTEDPSTLPERNCDKLNVILSQINKTSRFDIIERLRLNVLCKAAKELNCNKIFTGETSDHIATKIISNIAIGRGRQLPSDTGFSCTLDQKILLIRPLRECSKKEVVFFNVFNKLHLYDYPWLQEENRFSSIQKLTEGFLTDLQQSFPSTVATVTSTGSKLSVAENSEDKCLMCQSSLDNEKRELTAGEAMKISRAVTNCGPSGFNCKDFTPINNSDVTNLSSLEELPVCYACNIIISESKKGEELLDALVHNAKQVERQTMYNEIKDFLL